MRNLVTGGAGFIGAHLVRQLLERGEAVRILDLAPPRDADERIEVIEGSVTDPGAVAKAMDGIDCVFHLAANAHLWAQDKSVFHRINVHGTETVLAAAKSAGVARFIQTSSLTVLIGRNARKGGSVDETLFLTDADMLGPYCRSKLEAERIVRSAAADGFSATTVLPTMPIGPGDYGLTAPTRMLLDLVNGKTPAYLECMMNLADVRDIAAGHIAARDRGEPGGRYLLGADNLPMSVMLERVAAVTGLKMPRSKVPYAVAVTAGFFDELIADRITGRPPKAPLTGVRLAGRPVSFDCASAQTALELTTRPLETSLKDAIRWLMDEGLVTRPVPGLS